MSDSFAVTGFTSQLLLEEQDRLTLPSLSVADALEIGQIATALVLNRGYPLQLRLESVIGLFIMHLCLDQRLKIKVG